MVEKKRSEGKLESKRFFKSRKDRVIDGVCGGLADYLGLDVTLIRIMWLLGILVDGLGLIAYLLSMILVPVNPAHKNLTKEEKTKRDTIFLWGAVLIVLGLFFFFQRWDLNYLRGFPTRFYWWWKSPWRSLWPLGLVVLGIVYIIRVLRKEKKVGSERNNETNEGHVRKKLLRTPDDKLLGGVCGGIGRFLSIDPVLVRVGFAVFALATNVLVWIILYVALVIGLPQKEVGEVN